MGGGAEKVSERAEGWSRWKMARIELSVIGVVKNLSMTANVAT